ISNLRSLRLQNVEIGSEYLHDHRRGRSGQCLFNAFGDELHDIECEPDNLSKLAPHIVKHFIADAWAVFELDFEFVDLRSEPVVTNFSSSGSLRCLECLWNLPQPILNNGPDTH